MTQSPRPQAELYDEETGQPDRAVIEAAVADEEAEAREKAAQVERMAATDGWKQIEEWLFTQIEAAKEMLIDTEDIEKIRKAQSIARAYSNVLGEVHGRIQFLKALRESRSVAPSTDPA